MSAEYIERGAAIKTLIAAIHNDGFQGESNIERHELREDEIENALLSIPAADVEPVVHAHWIEHRESEDSRLIERYYECSHCHAERNFARYLKFCPDCGAHMDERSDA